MPDMTPERTTLKEEIEQLIRDHEAFAGCDEGDWRADAAQQIARLAALAAPSAKGPLAKIDFRRLPMGADEHALSATLVDVDIEALLALPDGLHPVVLASAQGEREASLETEIVRLRELVKSAEWMANVRGEERDDALQRLERSASRSLEAHSREREGPGEALRNTVAESIERLMLNVCGEEWREDEETYQHAVSCIDGLAGKLVAPRTAAPLSERDGGGDARALEEVEALRANAEDCLDPASYNCAIDDVLAALRSASPSGEPVAWLLEVRGWCGRGDLFGLKEAAKEWMPYMVSIAPLTPEHRPSIYAEGRVTALYRASRTGSEDR